jgi:hypothetical protein
LHAPPGLDRLAVTGNLIIIALYIATAITVAITGTSLLARRAATGKPAAAVL